MTEATASPAMRITQVRDRIADIITERGLRAGDQMPTENELTALLGTARYSTREALKLLEQEGVITAVQGKGRFLSILGSLGVERPVTRYESTTEMLTGRGAPISTIVVSLDTVPASADTAAALGLERGTPVIRVVRLRFIGDEPHVYSINEIPAAALPGPLGYRDWSASVTAALEAHGSRITSSVARITSGALPADDAERHRLEGLGPWLLVEETCLTADGRRVLRAFDYHRGDRMAFHVVRKR